MSIRKNDIFELHADCRETHVPLRWLPGGQAAGLVAAGVGIERSGYRIRRHARVLHHLVIGVAGEGRVLIDDRWERILPGRCWVCPHGGFEHYELGSGRRWEIIWFTLDPDRGPWSDLLAGVQPALRSARWHGQLHRILSGIRREQLAEERSSEELLGHHAAALRIYLERELAPPDPIHPQRHAQLARLRAVFDQVREDLAAAWTVEELLRRSQLYISVDHFTRLCRHLLGRTPMQMVAKLRLGHCAHLLRCTDYNLETIAGLVGYRSAFALSNAFVREIGQRPRDYRQGDGDLTLQL